MGAAENAWPAGSGVVVTEDDGPTLLLSAACK